MEKPAGLNINLISSSKRNKVPKYLIWVFIMLGLLLLVFINIYVSQNKNTGSQQAKNQTLKAALASSRNEEKIYEPLQMMEQAIDIKRKEIEAIAKSQSSYAEVLNDIDKITAKPITIVGVEISPQRVTLNGYSPNHSEIRRILESIKATPGFTDVALLASEMSQTTDEVKFTLEIKREAPAQ